MGYCNIHMDISAAHSANWVHYVYTFFYRSDTIVDDNITYNYIYDER